MESSQISLLQHVKNSSLIWSHLLPGWFPTARCSSSLNEVCHTFPGYLMDSFYNQFTSTQKKTNKR